MPLFRTVLMAAARRMAADPRVQAKAAELLEEEVKPRAEAAWREAKPRLDWAKAGLKEAAREANPRERPREFVKKVKQRLFDPPEDES